jgi:hypothetical protein
LSKGDGFTPQKREQQPFISLLYFQFVHTYLLEREVGTTVEMGANPFAVTAEMANNKAELSFIIVELFFYGTTMINLHCQ